MRWLFPRGHGTGVASVTLAVALYASQAIAGPPFRTDDPVPVDYEHWEFYLFSTGTHVRGDSAATLPGIEVNYGVLPDLQLHVIAPLAFDHASGSSAQYGYGDTELGIKYRFIQENEQGWRPMVGVFPLLEVPTGNADHGLGTGSTHGYLPIWLQKSFGDWTTYGGGGYWINPGVGNKNYVFSGWLLQRKITDNLAFGGEIFTKRRTWSAVKTRQASISAAFTTSPRLPALTRTSARPLLRCRLRG